MPEADDQTLITAVIDWIPASAGMTQWLMRGTK
jgi:hypothetical protein